MKLAILGSGMVVQDFLDMVVDIPEIKLEAIFGTFKSMDHLKNIQKKYSINNIYTDIEECLDNKTIDTVYVALPNHLHYEFSKKSLFKNKNVICEKPFTMNLDELLELEKIALKKKLILIEAITNQYLTNYKHIKEDIRELGELKIIECNFSQYSSRYDFFKKGIILPVFNPKMGGGALMDTNIYNIHFVVGLLGKPLKVNYYANIEKDIDTSGILILDYGSIKAVCVGSKDSESEIRSTIQGTKGSITVNGGTNSLANYEKHMNSEKIKTIDLKIHKHRMYEEFKEFERIIKEHDMCTTKKMLSHGKLVMSIVDKAIYDANIKLG